MDKGYVFLFLCVCSSALNFSRALSNCPNQLTTIVEGYRHNGEEHFATEYTNSERLNDTHFRVCQCDVTPCLKKCCGQKQIMVNDECRNVPLDSVGFDTIVGRDTSHFHIIHGDGCPVKHFARFYPDDYSNVRCRVEDNGTVSVFFDDDVERQVQDFCLEKIFRTKKKTFGRLVCIPRDYSPDIYNFPLGMTMSIPFLLVVIVVYSLRELRNVHSKNLLSYVSSLLTAYLVVVVVDISKSSLTKGVCVILGLVRQFAFLSSFSWLNVMCFDLWWSLSSWTGYKAHSRDKERKKFVLYSVCGWGSPGVMVFVTTAIQFSPVVDGIIYPGIGLPNCFLRDGRPFYAYFYGPVIFIFCTDVTLFILSAVRFFTTRRKMKSVSVHDKVYMQAVKQRYLLLLKLFLLTTFNWIVEAFSSLLASSLWTWLFIHLSVTIQAICIFLMFVWKPEVRNLIASKFCSAPYDHITNISLICQQEAPHAEQRRASSVLSDGSAGTGQITTTTC